MHISTTALYVILLPFLGGLQAAHAALYEDAFGITNYGFQCEGRVYTKPVIYAAAKHLCEKKPYHFYLQSPLFSFEGYRGATQYDSELNTKASHLLSNRYYYIPIFEDGKLLNFVPRHVSKLVKELIQMDVGPDRLVIDENCNVVGAFSDLDYSISTQTARVVECRVLNSKEDYRSPISSSGSHQNFRDLAREQLPEILNIS